MHDTLSIVLGRVARVVRDRLTPAERRIVGALTVEGWEVGHPDGEPVPIAEAIRTASFAPVAIGDPWGAPWGTTWFRVRGDLPAHEAARGELIVDLGWSTASPGFQAEGLVMSPDGTIIKGLNPLSQWIPVTAGPIDMLIEAASNPVVFHRTERMFSPTRMGEKSTAGAAPQYRLVRADITIVDEHMRGLIGDLETFADLASVLPASDARKWEILSALERSLDALDPDDLSASAAAARKELAPVTASGARSSAHRVTAVGHAHIDSAWLWPLRETARKVARTTANVLRLMDEYPDLTFVMSSAQQWQWLQEGYPALFERMRERVAEGRVEPVGGMWVESDTMMVGGEAMVRQFVEGTAFFREELGARSRVVWLPDSFGYSAALPQIVKAAGFEAFLTQKISWNRTNPFPHHSFDWIGIDGSRVFTHFPPADTYNGELTAAELAHAAANFREKGRARMSLIPVGHGDGGGGPTREMIERAARVADVDGSPTVAFGTAERFFVDAAAERENRPTWFGELYLELHRGTLTSQLAMKQGNRRSEHLLREAELWWATAAVAKGAAYPYDELQRAWRTVLLHQFHDILPGSSISWVHREARETYARLARELGASIERAQRLLAEDRRLVFNARPTAAAGIAAGGAGSAAAMGSTGVESTAIGFELRGPGLAATVGATGHVVSLRTAEREFVAPGEVIGLLQLHDDKPVMWDAWDLDEHYRNRVRDLVDLDRISFGSDEHSAWVAVERSFGRSTVRQTYAVRDDEPGLHLRTDVDWHESEKVLKLAIPLDVHTDRATSETQFGHVHRPIDPNTSWDAARFEVCAHRWVHVGDEDGVAIANDSTYGHEMFRSARAGGGSTVVVRETLLRAPHYPDPDTDQGEHTLSHVIVPGVGIAGAVDAGYAINLPLRAAGGGARGSARVEALVQIDPASGILVESVALARDRSGDVIVRLYESRGRRARAAIEIGHPAGEGRSWLVTETDLHEDPAAPARPAWDGEQLRLGPFQIVTLRLSRPEASATPATTA